MPLPSLAYALGGLPAAALSVMQMATIGSAQSRQVSRSMSSSRSNPLSWPKHLPALCAAADHIGH